LKYDQEMGKSLSFEGIFAALAVLSTGVTTFGCSKSESARAVEEIQAAPAATTTTGAVAAAPMLAPTAASADGLTTNGGAGVDAGKELPPPPASTSLSGKAAPASCGAQGCSPDMKKGK